MRNQTSKFFELTHRVDQLRVPGLRRPGAVRGAVLEHGKVLQDVVLDRGDVGGADLVVVLVVLILKRKE